MQLTLTLLAVAGFLSAFAIGQAPHVRRWVLAGALVLVGIFGAVLVSAERARAPELEPGPVQVLRDGYVSSDRCRACHPAQYQSWQQSFHRTMTQPGTLAAVAAPLDGQPVELWGQRYRFFERDARPFVELPDPEALRSRQRRDALLIEDGARVTRPIALVTGSHHYQVYWVPSSDAADERDLVAVPVAWRIAEQRFIPRTAAFLMPPELSNRELPWALVCLKCHATGGRPGVDMQTDYVELGIACEACHGPGEAHVEHYQNPLNRYRAHREGDDARASASSHGIVDPAKLAGTRGSEICAQCHSLPLIEDADAYIEHGTPFRPGDAIAEHFPDVVAAGKSEVERAQMFWSDGEIRVTGREWVSMIRSKCHTQGQLGCMDCHSMHEGARDDQLHDVRGGDEGCVRCHEVGRYAVAAHTHHAEGSSGSSCLNCHMPPTSYGLLGAIRTHTIASPRVTTQLETGRPNACNLCHLDRTLAWTAEQLATWYGHERVPVTGLPATVADSVRLALAGDAGQRALALAAMGWAPAREVSGTDWMAPFLVLSLNDPYDAVRQIAFATLRMQPEYEQLAYDPLAPAQRRIDAIVDLVPEWFERYRGEIAAMPEAVPLDPTFGFDRRRLDMLLSSRDGRAILLTE